MAYQRHAAQIAVRREDMSEALGIPEELGFFWNYDFNSGCFVLNVEHPKMPIFENDGRPLQQFTLEQIKEMIK